MIIAGIVIIMAIWLYVRRYYKDLCRYSDIKIIFNTNNFEEVDKIMQSITNNNNVGKVSTTFEGRFLGYIEIVNGSAIKVGEWIRKKLPDDIILSIEVRKKDRVIFINGDNLYEIKCKSVS